MLRIGFLTMRGGEGYRTTDENTNMIDMCSDFRKDRARFRTAGFHINTNNREKAIINPTESGPLSSVNRILLGFEIRILIILTQNSHKTLPGLWWPRFSFPEKSSLTIGMFCESKNSKWATLLPRTHKGIVVRREPRLSSSRNIARRIQVKYGKWH